MKQHLPTVLVIPFILTLIFVFSIFSQKAYSLTNNIVISEVQIGATDADDEFIELYNPTSSAIVIDGWRLTRKTPTGTESTLVNSIAGTVNAHSFFLIAKPTTYTGATLPDLNYSAGSNSITNNNTILLYSDAGITVVDKVGLGTATDVETTSISNPSSGGSVERKASSSSTNTSMSGGSDETLGNGEDTNNNSLDFVLQEVSNPQNSSSSEVPSTSTSPSPSASSTPAPTATPTPEPSPTPSPSPTPEPSTSPTPSPSPSATPNPTPTPSSTPIPSPSVTPAPSSTPQPSVSPTPHPVVFGAFNIQCRVEYRTFRSFFLNFRIPVFSCTRI